MTLASLKHKINVPVEIDELKMFVSILIRLVGSDLIKNVGIPSVPELCLVFKPEIYIFLYFLKSSRIKIR